VDLLFFGLFFSFLLFALYAREQWPSSSGSS
jgi:hypothetical protein